MQDDLRRLRHDLHAYGLDAHNHSALLMLPLIHVAWADGKIDAAERAAILAFAVNNRLVEREGLQLVERWLEHAPDDADFERGLDLLVRLAWCDSRATRAISPDLLATAVDFCDVVARTSGGLFTDIPDADREALEEVEVEVARLHAEHGPDDGFVGRPLTPDWIALLEELKSGNTHNHRGRHAS